MSAVTIRHCLPAEIVAIAPEVQAKAAALIARAAATEIAELAQLQPAEDLYRVIVALGKEISEGRLEITRPIDALKKQIIAAEEGATAPLLDAKRDLEKRIAAFRAAEQARREEAARQARLEAEKRAAAERARLEAEAAAERFRLIEERQEAIRLAEAEAAIFGMPAPVVKDLPPPAPIVVVPVVEAPLVAELPKSAVRSSKAQRLEIVDSSLIPRTIAGAVLLQPDEPAIKRLLLAGVQVPGCRLVTESRLGSAG